MIASRRFATLSGSMALGIALVTGAVHPALADRKPKVPPVSVERTDGGEPVLVHEGEASFYSQKFHGRETANGERMNQNKPTAASRALPLGTRATVTNQENGKSVDVIVNDRGPYVDGRVIDLSRNAARKLDMIEDGTAPVRVEMKPSEQPNDAAKEKVEARAEKAGKPARAGSSGGNTSSHSGSGK
ncbi:septal ring lytic transglycosylase RlpA family protein [Azospirillum doebereinerae]